MSPVVLPHSTETTSMLDVVRPESATAIGPQLQAAIRQSGRSSGALVRSYARLAVGRGRVSFADFIKLRLFDEGFHEGEPDGFVGTRRNRDLCVTINHRHGWLGMLGNKVAALSYLAAYGYPTLPILAVFAPAVATGSARVLPDRAALRRFLSDPALYPLFGKPVESCQSLGSIGLRHLDPSTGCVERLDGRTASVERLVEEIAGHYASGYLFQHLAVPHPTIESLCGRRLATARMLTLLTAEGPLLFRAAWKIPVGGHAADNFWRSGNLLASLGTADGRIGRAVAGAGLEGREVETHPDTGITLPGLVHPQWDDMRRLVLEAAGLLRHVPMIGWDVACTADGPVIVETNELPDFFLVQYAEGRGVCDDEFSRFAAYQRGQARRDDIAGRRAIRKL